MKTMNKKILLLITIISFSSLSVLFICCSVDETESDPTTITRHPAVNPEPSDGNSGSLINSKQGSGTVYAHVEEPPEPAWTRYGVVIDLGKDGAYDDKSVESPIVIKQDDDTYVMWYRGHTYADKIGRIMRAISFDGIHWTKTGVVMEPTEDYEGNKVDPMTVIYEDGVYKMWYGASRYGGSACYATSPDGINWAKYPGNPVLKKTSGSWDNKGAGGQHCVIKIENTYKMYYKGYGSDDPGWTFYGLAESSDGINWTKRGVVISPQPELGEKTTFKNLYVFSAGDYFFIMHTMSDYLHLFLISGSDCENWCRNGVVFRQGQTPGKWDIKWATSPCLIFEDGIAKMWYEGGDEEGRVRALYAEITTDYFLKICRETVISTKSQG